MTNEKAASKKHRMSDRGNLQISAWFISTHNERYFRRGNIYNRRNFQLLYSTRKTAVRFGTNTVT